MEWKGWVGNTPSSAGSVAPLGWPSRAQSAVVSPTDPACVAQDHLEPVLLRHLASLGAARVQFATEVTAVETGAEGVSRHSARRRHGRAGDGSRALPRWRRRRAQRGTNVLGHPDAWARRSRPGGDGAVSRAAVGPPRRAPLRPLRHQPPRRRGQHPARRAAVIAGCTARVRPGGEHLAGVTEEKLRRPSGPPPATRPCGPASSASARSPSPPNSRSASGRAALSSSETPRTG